MTRFLVGFIVGCFVMYVGPIKIANGIAKTIKSIQNVTSVTLSDTEKS
jgi:hypothetical protein